jgi:hypothetical protein
MQIRVYVKPFHPFDVARIQHFVAWEQHEAAALTVEAQM